MKKIIVSGVCTTLVCFLLSSFAPNSNNVAGADGIYVSNFQDTTHNKKMNSKKKMKTDKTTGDTTKTKTKKTPA